ncbi:hypothetical protein PanWU01x14_000440, partial [Parasponia andersonii]
RTPKQNKNVEYGFYVLRYTGDIMDYKWDKIPFFFGQINEYKRVDIDEVRNE